MSYVFTLFCLALVVATLYLFAARNKNRLSATTWEQLLSRLEAVPTAGIAKVALDYLQPAKGQLAIETDAMWLLVGGAEGLKRMQANADLLVQLAAFAEQWNLEECVIVGERMRREARTLHRAARKIQIGLVCGYGRSLGPFYVQEATSTYYLMRKRLLALYETSHVGRHARLSIALGDAMAAYGPAF